MRFFHVGFDSIDTYGARGTIWIEMNQKASRRVLLVSPLPPPSGGIASWTRILMTYGLPAGFEPIVVNTRKASYDRGPLSRMRELIRTSKILSSLIYKTVRHRPKLVHLNCSLSCDGIFRDLACGALARLFGRPLLTHYRGDIPYYMERCGPRGLRTPVLRALLRMSRMNVALNAASLACVKRFAPPQTCVLLPNFIEDDILRMVGENVAHSAGGVRALYVGNFLAEKGLEHIRTVSRTLPEVHFDLVGDDVEGIFNVRDDVPGNITIFGPMERESVLRKMRGSDFYLFPSRSEGFPNSVLEAMAMGLPVVATRVGAIPEMIDDGKGGYLVEKDDTEALAGVIRRIASDRRLREQMGNYNREQSRRYAYSTVIAQLASLYEKLL